MKIYHILVTLFLSMIGNVALAQEVSVETAKGRALDFLTSEAQGAMRAKGRTVKDLELAYTSRSEEKTCFYVFNVGEDDGFVIAGGDASAHEILGYCDHGTFDYESAPENFKWWLSQYTHQIENAVVPIDTTEDVNTSSKARRRAKATTERQSIGPLIQTKWNQDYPYNSEIPIYASDSARYVTGCVATAMAQIMNYWKHPKQGTGSYSYTYEGNTFSADFGGTTYDWDHMVDNYSYGYFDEDVKAVGTLMYHAGVAAQMQYGTSASGAYNINMVLGLFNYFGYDRSMRKENLMFYTDEAWEEMYYNELAAGRPILIEGLSSVITAHMFICDGYDNASDMFSINWGWGAFCDGYYKVTGTGYLNPDTSSRGGIIIGDGYNDFQYAYLNVQPECGGVEEPHLTQNAARENPLYLSVNDVVYDDNFDYTYGTSGLSCFIYTALWNHGFTISDFDLGVKATEVTTGITEYWLSSVATRVSPLNHLHCYLTFTPADLIYNGVYELRPVYRQSLVSNAEWYEVDLLPSETIPTITVTGGKDPAPIDIPFTIESDTMQTYRSNRIVHPSNYTGNVVYSSSDESITRVDEQGNISGTSPGEVVITVSGEAQGLYRETTRSFNLTVIDVIPDTVAFAISDTLVMVGKTLQIGWTDVFDGALSFSSTDQGVAKVDAEGVVTALSAGIATITAVAEPTYTFQYSRAEFDIMVIDDSIYFVKPPYFNTEENICYGEGIDLCYNAKNASSDTCAIPIYYTFFIGRLNFSGSCEVLTSVKPGEVAKITSNYVNIGAFMEPGTDYTMYFYRDKDKTIPFNYPSTTLHYYDSLIVDYNIGPSGYGTLIVPFDCDLPAKMKVFSCSGLDEEGAMILRQENGIKRNVPYIVQAIANTSYRLYGANAIDPDKPTFTKGLLVGAVGENVPLVAGTDYILREEDGKIAFYPYTEGASDSQAEQFSVFIRLENACDASMIYLPGLIYEEENDIYFCDDVYYKLDVSAMTAEVVAPISGAEAYSGDIIIPSTIEYEGETYRVTSIAPCAFQDCTEVTSVTMGDNVTQIGYSAFERCKALTSVTIGKGILSIGDSAFCNCTSLASITVLVTEPPHLDDLTFSNVDKDNCVVWVPFGCKSTYEAASLWSEFKDIRELEAELTLLGDANYDGKVRIGDATAILNYIVGIEVEGFNAKNADVNQDGKIRIGDVTGVLNIIVGE